MNSSSIKIRQEKENIKTVSKRISFTNQIKDRLMDKLINEISKISEETTAAERSDIYDDLLNDIVDSSISMGKIDIDILTKRLHEAMEQVGKDTERMLGVSHKKVSPEFIEKVINHTIDGKTYSDRIWKNQVKLASEVADTVEKHIKENNVDMQQFKKDIARRYEVDDYVARRLIDDQVSRVEYQVKDEKYRQSGLVRKVERITMEDDRVSELCASEHGDVWDIDDPDKPSLPRHIGCRCMYRPYYDGMEEYSFIK